MNINFYDFRENMCRYMKLGADEFLSHDFYPTCRHKDNKPKGCSWGTCDEQHCPFFKNKKTETKKKDTNVLKKDEFPCGLKFSDMNPFRKTWECVDMKCEFWHQCEHKLKQ